MYIVLLDYVRPLAEVDRWVAEHRAYLEQHYAAGRFLLSGRKEPRTGGVILVKAQSRAEVDVIIASDPFHREGVAQYQVVEFLPSLSAPELAHLL